MGMWSTMLGFGAGYALGANKDNVSIRRMRSGVMLGVGTNPVRGVLFRGAGRCDRPAR